LVQQAPVVQPAGSTGIPPTLRADGVVSVRDYQADPTGVIDSTAVIQAAIDAAAGGGRVLVPPGTYLISDTLVMATGVVLEGVGPNIFSSVPTTGNAVIKLAAGSDCDMVQIPTGVKNVTIRNLVLDGNGLKQSSGDGIVVDSGAACISIDHCKVVWTAERGIVHAGGYAYITFTDVVRAGKHGLYVSGGDLSVMQCEIQDSDAGNTGTYSNVHLAATAAANVFISVKCGNDNTTGLDGIHIVAGSSLNRFVGVHMQNNTRYGIYNAGFRNSFTNCVSAGKSSAGCHAFYDDTTGAATVISGCTFIANNASASALYVDSNVLYPLSVGASNIGPGAGGTAFTIAAGKFFYRDGVKFQPEASADATRVLTLAPNSTTTGVGGQIRVGTSTDDGTTGISIRGTRDAAGAHGGWRFYTRNAGGEQERVHIDRDGLLTGLAGVAVKNGSTSAGYIDLHEKTDNGTNRVRMQPPATLDGDYTAKNGTLVLDDGVNWRVMLMFKAGLLVDVTTGAPSAPTATWTADEQPPSISGSNSSTMADQ